jgi:hypothetical protein
MTMTNFDKEFLAEIARSNGTDSLVYVWALATVRENYYKRLKAAKKGDK